MKKKVIVTFIFVAVVLTALMGCGVNSSETKNTESVVETEVQTELIETETEVHEHAYVEEVTTEASCETNGVKTFICECGDSYTEEITAVGHVYENYVYNEDATYLADGTETAVCNGCELTDSRTAEGTKLEYTYTDISVTKYAKQSVNVRNLPSTDGEKLGGLSTNNEVVVTGQCNETGWYRIDYNGEVAYVSNNYLVDEKVEVQVATTTTSASTNTSSGECPYPLYEIMYDNRGLPYFYGTGTDAMDFWSSETAKACDAEMTEYKRSLGMVCLMTSLYRVGDLDVFVCYSRTEGDGAGTYPGDYGIGL